MVLKTWTNQGEYEPCPDAMNPIISTSDSMSFKNDTPISQKDSPVSFDEIFCGISLATIYYL